MYIKMRLLGMYLEHPIKKHMVFWVPGPGDPLVLTAMPSWLIPASEGLTLWNKAKETRANSAFH